MVEAEGLAVHVGDLAEVAGVLEIEGVVFGLGFVWDTFLGLGGVRLGIEEIWVERFIVVGFVVNVLELVEFEALIDDLPDYFLEVVLFGLGGIKKIEGGHKFRFKVSGLYFYTFESSFELGIKRESND